MAWRLFCLLLIDDNVCLCVRQMDKSDAWCTQQIYPDDSVNLLFEAAWAYSVCRIHIKSK